MDHQQPSTSSTASPSTSAGASSERSLVDEIANVLNLNNNSCSNCEPITEATFHCTNCDEFYCDHCAMAHKRIRQTKEHKLTRFVNRPFLSPAPTTAPDSNFSSPRTNSTPSPSQSNPICDTHLESKTFFCDTCLMSICPDCALSKHRTHKHSQFQQVIESATIANRRLSQEAFNAISAISRTMNHIQCIVDSIDFQSFQAIKDVDQFTKYLQSLLDKKREEVITKINKTRKERVDRLSSQIQNLRFSQSRLGYIASLLSETHTSSNPAEMVVANEQAVKQLNFVRSLQNDLFPCENDNINFLYDKSQFRRLVGLTDSAPAAAAVAAPAPPSQASTSFATPSTSFASPSTSVAVFNPRPQQISVYDRIPMPATDLFRFYQSMPSCRPIYGLVGQVLVPDSVRKVPMVLGRSGEGPGNFCRPWGVCCNSIGNFFVADRSNNRIQVFDANGVFLYQFGRMGKAPGEFDRPAGLVINPDGNLIVADKDNHRIQVFKMDGAFLFTFGQRGTEHGEFNYPWDVACNIQGNIVVSDTRNHRIQLFSSNGVFLNKYGFEPGMWKHFDSPRSVCFTPNGHIACTDFNNHRVVVIERGLNKAQCFGNLGHDSRDLCRPQGIICDDNGNFIVADSRNNRVQVFDCVGNFMYKIGYASGPLAFDRPSGVCLTPDGRVAIVDFGKDRVQIY